MLDKISVQRSPDGMDKSCAIDCKVGPLHFYVSGVEAEEFAKQLLKVVAELNPQATIEEMVSMLDLGLTE